MKIVVFTCNWDAYSGLENAGRRRLSFPASIRPVKVMCLGRLNPGTLLKAFEYGADGVLMQGCTPGQCHYDFGTRRAEEVFQTTRELMLRLGYPAPCLRLDRIEANDGDGWVRSVQSFADSIPPKLEKVPPEEISKAAASTAEPTPAPEDIATRHRAWYCLDCGKCSSVCPVTPRETRRYCSPRILVEQALYGPLDDLIDDPLFWSCTTCQRCSQMCPSDVAFSDFLRETRQVARRSGYSGACTHGDVVQTWGRIMTRPDRRPNRLQWLEDDDTLRISDASDILFFVGCAPYYDILFKHLKVEGTDIPKSAVKILNHLGIAPQVLADERCCGHDQLWEGEVRTFRALARLNLERIIASGAKTIVTTCPECARTLSVDYPRLVENHGLKVQHLSEFVSRRLARSGAALAVSPQTKTATFQDPCRLGRHMGIYDAPRGMIAAAGMELVEMEHTRHAALCCGTSGWTACGQVNKRIQTDRLAEAQATGAEVLITACIKCQIHLKCARQDTDMVRGRELPIRDWTTMLADRLVGK